MKRPFKALSTLVIIVLLFFSLAGQALAGETSSEQVIKEELHHIILQNGSGYISVVEIIQFKNTSQDTFIGSTGAGGQKEVLKVSLPPGYSNLQVQGIDQKNIVLTDGGIATTQPVQGNNVNTLTVTYTLPGADQSKLILEKTIKYFSDRFYILSPQGSLTVSGSGIYDSGVQNIQGRAYQIYSVNPPPPGKKLDIYIAPGKVVSRSYDPGKIKFHSASHIRNWYNSPFVDVINPHLLTFFTVVMTAGVGVGVFYLRKKRKLQEETEKDDEEAFERYSRLLLKEKNLLKKIKELDRRYKRGEIGETEYDVTRNEYKKILIKVKLSIKELEAIYGDLPVTETGA